MDHAARLIREGQVVAFPTETVYGLGADGLNQKAVAKIFKAKGRPQDNPLILHIDSVEMLHGLVREIPEGTQEVMDRFWPGPLTILFRKSQFVPDIITAGLDTVAIRMPSHPVALELIKRSGTPIAAPSANTSGKPSPTKASHVIEDMDGKIAMIIDGGDTGVGLESTVLDMTEGRPVILRPGGVTIEELRDMLPDIILDPGLEEGLTGSSKPRSPGQKYRHYAPRAEMVLYSGEPGRVVSEMVKRAKEEELQGKKVGLLVTQENRDQYPFENLVVMGSSREMKTIAHSLFDSIRKLDEMGVDLILCESVAEDHIGMAIMNRLVKAAGGNRIKLQGGNMKILFVCTGNTCRSPMAETILKQEAEKRGYEIQVHSAGIFAMDGDRASEGARGAMKDRGGLPDHRSRFLDMETLKWADLVLVMTNAHKRNLLSRYPQMGEKIHNLNDFAVGDDQDVEDPFGGSIDAYVKVKKQLEDVIDSLLDKLYEGE